MTEQEIPDKIYILSMLNLICKRLEISELDIEYLAMDLYKGSKLKWLKKKN